MPGMPESFGRSSFTISSALSAIKVPPASFPANADRLRRFEQEAKAAGVLNHPNITAVYDIGQHDGAPYVVQRWGQVDLLGGHLQPDWTQYSDWGSWDIMRDEFILTRSSPVPPFSIDTPMVNGAVPAFFASACNFA